MSAAVEETGDAMVCEIDTTSKPTTTATAADKLRERNAVLPAKLVRDEVGTSNGPPFT